MWWTACLVSLMFVAAAHAQLVETPIEYTLGGVTFRGVLIRDEARADERRPGVLVCHEWWGLNDYARQRGRMLAELGYVAFCADLYGLDDVGQPRVAATREQAQALVAPVYQDRAMMKARARAALDVLADQPTVDPERLAAIGYCFGGTVALELARSGAPLVGTVSFHGNLLTPDRGAERIAGAVLVCHGAADPMGGADMVQEFTAEMEGAGVDYQVVSYAGALHAFTNPAADAANIDGVGYDEAADRRSWQHMQVFFGEVFGEPVRFRGGQPGRPPWGNRAPRDERPARGEEGRPGGG